MLVPVASSSKGAGPPSFAGGFGAADIYASTLLPDDTFGPAVLVPELSSPAADIVPNIRRDGLEMLITSNRPGSMPFPPPATSLSFDLWVSTRESTDDVWSVPVNLGAPVNSRVNDGWAALSFDGTILYFSTGRSDGLGGLDLYASARSEVRVIGRLDPTPRLLANGDSRPLW